MGMVSFIIGVLTIIGACISLFPIIHYFNCILVPLALVGAILGLVDVIGSHRKGWGIAGLIMNSLAFMVGAGRLILSLFLGGF